MEPTTVQIYIDIQIELCKRVERAFENLKKEKKENRTFGFIVAKQKEFQRYHTEINLKHEQIFGAIPANLRKKTPYLEEQIFEISLEKLSGAEIRLEEWLHNLTTPAPLSTVPAAPNTILAPQGTRAEQIRLPRIQIESFAGDHHKWLSFKNLFVNLVHNKIELSPVEKFHHLLSNLSGTPKASISHYSITNENYEAAWQTLQKRYDNNYALVNSEIKRMMNLEKMNVESASQIRQMLDTITESLNSLNNLKIDTTTWDPILIYHFLLKISEETNRHWQDSIEDPTAVPTINSFLKFLERRSRTLESLSETVSNVAGSSRFHPQYRNNYNNRSSPNRNQQASYQNRPYIKRNPNSNSYNRPSANNSWSHSKPTTSRSSNPFRTRENSANNNDEGRYKAFLVRNAQGTCAICDNPHNVWNCQRFLQMDVPQRLVAVTERKLCNNCVANHAADKCTSSKTCKYCQKRHHTLLHSTPNIENKKGNETQSPFTASTSNVLSHMATEVAPQTQVLLATALVDVKARDGTMHTLRCLLDQGSQASFVTHAAIQHLQVPTTTINATISGLGATRASNAKSAANLHISSKYNMFAFPMTALVISKITDNLPSYRATAPSSWTHIKGLQLADPKYIQPNKIDILLGADVYGQIVLEGIRRGIEGSPVAQHTQLGWILFGRIEELPTHERDAVVTNKQTTNFSTNLMSFHHRVNIDTQLKAFWEIEEMDRSRILTKDETTCEKLFYKTISRDETGRFTVGLPFKDGRKELGHSKQRALMRLKQQQVKFQRQPDYYRNYSAVVDEYKELNHMKPSTENNNQEESYYMPHHAVIKESSTTTKLRVVFDASAKTTSGESLNQQLLVGPTLQSSLAAILMRWRIHDIILAADITQMYRQIRIRSEDTRFQKMLWFEGSTVKEFELQTLTFGTSPAAYLAVKTLQHLASIEEERYPKAASVVLSDFYVDDLLTGANTEEDAINMYNEITKLLASGGFVLRKWISNNDKVLRSIPEESREISLPLSFDLDSTSKTLGMHYHPASDQFQFKVHEIDTIKPPTKRRLLSDISRLFDPLGLVAPITIKAKIFMQRLWQKGYDWDQKITGTLMEDWLKFSGELKKVEELRINRWLGQTGSNETVQLHGFCDASEQAYAAAVYTRFTNKNGDIIISLVTSKTKVAPLKSISLPRLELCGAVLLSKLLASTKRALQLQSPETFAWTDSEIVLAWLAGQPTRWKTFVANRVVEILEFTEPGEWRHIKSQDNPADCASRGLFPAELAAFEMWWSGPTWLKTHQWPTSKQNLSDFNTELEKKTTAVCTFISTSADTIINKYSSLTKLLRIVATIQRFCFNCKNRINKRTSNLNTEEINSATTACIKIVQQLYAKEIKDLQMKREINNNSSILSLNPFLDEHNILRVGGRIDNATLPFQQKHPILLPSSSEYTKLIINDAHIRTQHGGVQLTTTITRKKYWIVRARNSVKKAISKCITCQRYRPTKTTQIMAALPKSRLAVNRPFANVGVDYAGPLDVRVSKGRGTKSYKGYIALFICFSTKAVHLEVVSDLTTQAFLAAFNRFTARRGLPTDVYSDNGTNFVGADRALRKLIKATVNSSTISTAAVKDGIQWHFIPARSPHFGGLWEAGIKQVKLHLIKTIQNTTLTFEELSTVLAQIEASLNSRPLTQLSSDPNDFSALTPGHFLIGNELLAPPVELLTENNISTLNRWRLLQKLNQNFWRRWSQEYLTNLQQRYKWKQVQKQIKEGDMVILKEDNQPPNKWKLGRIEKTHPGADGNVRVVTVNTPTGQYQRAITKVVLLPISNEEE